MEKKKPGPKPINHSYLMDSLRERQTLWIVDLMKKDGYTVKQIAAFLNIHRQTLYTRINDFVGVTTLTPPNYLLVNKDTKIKLDPLLEETNDELEDVVNESEQDGDNQEANS